MAKDAVGNEIEVLDIIVYGLRSGDGGGLRTGIVTKVANEKITAITTPSFSDGSTAVTFNFPNRACVIGRVTQEDSELIQDIFKEAARLHKVYYSSWDGKKFDEDKYIASLEGRFVVAHEFNRVVQKGVAKVK